MKNLISRLSISTQLILLLAGFALLLTLLLAAILDKLFSQRTQENIGRQFSEFAIQTNDKLDRTLFERHREILLLANRPEFASAVIPAAQKRQVLEALQKSYSFYAWLGITDTAGRVLVAANGLLEGADVASRPWFHNALSGTHLTDVHNAVLLSDLLRPYGAEPMRFIDISVPYHDGDGRIAGVFGAHLSFEWAEEIEKSVLLPLLRRNGVETIIVSKDGTVILGPKDLAGTKFPLPANALASPAVSGYAVEKFSDGKDYVLGYSRSRGYGASPGLGWTVVVRQDLDAAYAPVAELRQQVVMAGLCIALLFAALGYFLAKRISRPLCLITESAQRIESGEARGIAQVHDGCREIGILHASLQSLIGRLQANETSMRLAEQRKDEFLATLAHELRNPIAPISAAADLLAFAKSNAAQQQRLAEVISRQTRHMTALIDDLLDVSRVTRGLVALDKKPVVMQDVVGDALEQTRALIEAQGHRIELRLPEQPAVVSGDKNRLVQVVANLLTNAAKYTPAGGGIVLTTSAGEGQVVLSIRDNGIGMSPELMALA